MKTILQKITGLFALVLLLITLVGSVNAEKLTLEGKGNLNSHSPAIQAMESESEEKSPFVKVGEDDRYIKYEGEATVEGRFYKVTHGGFGDPGICFEVDADDAHLIPHPFSKNEHDVHHKVTWFCFQNQKEAESLFGLEGVSIEPTDPDNVFQCSIEGSAIITISGYVIDKLEAEVIDTTKLEKVVQHQGAHKGCSYWI